MGSVLKSLGACLGLFVCVVLTSCNGGPQADFSLSSTPGAISLVAGGAGQQISVSLLAANGFMGMVSVAVTGLPSGVTAQPATLTLTPGTAQSLTLTATAAAAVSTTMFTLTGTSGSLTHSAATAITITPAPDYTLTLSPTTLTIVAGATGSPVSVTVNALNSFSGTVAVAITGLPTGVTANPATLSVVPGTPQSTTLTAALSTAAATTSTVTFTGTSGNLVHAASLSLTKQPPPLTLAPDVTTYHYDVARDGLNPQETILTQANVNSTQFGKVGFDTVDGKVDAEPLYLANLIVGGQLHNVLFVASEHGSVYAFDADSGTQLWKTSVIPSTEMTSDDHKCSQITTEIGITSTPVIDRQQGPNGTIFTVAMSKDASGAYHHRLHALDITTGAETGTPTEITASFPGTGDNSQNGNVVFDPSQYAERAALLLLNGNIYTAFTSHCDIGLYTGWVMAYSETSLQQTQLINLTPNGHDGSIWMSGSGLAADSSGNMYLLDANGTFDTTMDANGNPANGDYGNAMVKLTGNGKLAVVDYFEAYNTVSQSSQDVDLGSGGAVLLPDQVDASGVVHHLIVGAGKDKNIYLANRDNLGKFNPSTTSPMDANIYQKITGQLAGLNYTTPVYFNGVLYFGSDGDALKAFPLTNAKLATAPTSLSAATFAHPGTTPAVSANGTQNGIVWAVQSALTAPGVLHAYDPTNLAHEFYNSNQAASGRDAFGNGNKFITPLVVNGKVYVGTQTGVAVFGLLPH